MAIRPVRLTALACIAAPVGVIVLVILFFIASGFARSFSEYTHIDRDGWGQNAAPAPNEKRPDYLSAGPRVVPTRGARLFARTANDEVLAFPMIKSEYRVDIRGDMATVRVRQTFKNPGDIPLNANYEFPLHEQSAVFAMTMRSGDQRVRAEIKRKQEAEEIFEDAKHEGKTAALLTQERPNLFNQSIANLMPGHPVEVELRYVQPVSKAGQRYQLDLPLEVGQRYRPSDMSGNYLVKNPDGSTDAAEHQGKGSHHTDESPVPENIDSNRVSVEVRIDGGVPVHAIESSSHRLSTSQLAPNIWEARLDEGRAIPNKTFTLSYRLGGEQTDAGLVTYYDKDAEMGYWGLLIEPPAALKPDADEVVPREMVFVIDASGSMQGAPMEANKAYMRHTLQNLRPDDTFRIIEFSQAANEYLQTPTPATPDNIAEALAYVEAMQASGGSNIKSAIEQALSPQTADGYLRLVTFLTDGKVQNEFETLRTLNDKLGQARLFALGVGSNVNRYLLGEMGEMGNGFTQYIDPNRDVRQQAIQTAKRLQTPVLTDIHVDWGGLTPDGITSAQIPDLFAGQSVRLRGKFKKTGTYHIVVHGLSGRGRVSLPIKITVPDAPAAGRAVELAWARSTIDDYMKELLTPEGQRESTLSDVQIKNLVTSVGLEHSLVSQWTSFVAVSEEVVNPNSNAPDTWSTLSQTGGASATHDTPGDYASNTNNSYNYAPSTASTPEPATWAGLLLAAIAVIFALWSPRRREQPLG